MIGKQRKKENDFYWSAKRENIFWLVDGEETFLGHLVALVVEG
jgi:hypothetical protein